MIFRLCIKRETLTLMLMDWVETHALDRSMILEAGGTETLMSRWCKVGTLLATCVGWICNMTACFNEETPHQTMYLEEYDGVVNWHVFIMMSWCWSFYWLVCSNVCGHLRLGFRMPSLYLVLTANVWSSSLGLSCFSRTSRVFMWFSFVIIKHSCFPRLSQCAHSNILSEPVWLPDRFPCSSSRSVIMTQEWKLLLSFSTLVF